MAQRAEHAELIGIEKCSSPIGDGNSVIRVLYIFAKNIEKCSSPIGDGNKPQTFKEQIWEFN